MPGLDHVKRIVMKPVQPYDFRLTLRKPAGWPLFTPFEVYEKGTLWTATHVCGLLTGLKLTSPEPGTVRADIHLREGVGEQQLSDIERTLVHCIGADEDLSEFYEIAEEDDILKHAVKDLYGMHNTLPSTVFPDASLAILLQMTNIRRSNEMMSCFISHYGETARFDGRSVRAWPTPAEVVKVEEKALAEACKVGYRAKFIVRLARKLHSEAFPTIRDLEGMEPEEARELLLTLPGIGDYSADIVNPHGGFPIDVWSADVFGLLFFGHEPEDKRKAIDLIKREGLRRWGKWSWMAFLYIVQDLKNLSRKLGVRLRLS